MRSALRNKDSRNKLWGEEFIDVSELCSGDLPLKGHLTNTYIRFSQLLASKKLVKRKFHARSKEFQWSPEINFHKMNKTNFADQLKKLFLRQLSQQECTENWIHWNNCKPCGRRTQQHGIEIRCGWTLNVYKFFSCSYACFISRPDIQKTQSGHFRVPKSLTFKTKNLCFENEFYLHENNILFSYQWFRI